MRKSSMVWGVVTLVLLSAGVLLAEDHAKPMTNDDVVSMVKAGLPEDIIIGSINEQATNFDVSASALVSLKNQGVSVKIMQAMLGASGKHHDSSPPAGADKNTTPQASGESAPPAESTAQQPPAKPAAREDKPASSTNILDKLNQIQTQVSGAVTQAQGTAQQLRGSSQQLRGTPQAGQGTALPGLPNLATPPAAAPTATPAASAQAAAQAQAVQRQQQMAARQAALQQQRQQQIAARQAAAQGQAQKVGACVKQFQQEAPGAKTPAQRTALQKSYAACVQAARQSK
jgi:hypothetical protein